MEITPPPPSPYWISFSTTRRRILYQPSSFPRSQYLFPTSVSIIVHPSLRQNHSSIQLVIATVADKASLELICISEKRSLISSPSTFDTPSNRSPLTIVLELKVRASEDFFPSAHSFELKPNPALSSSDPSPRVLFSKHLPLSPEHGSCTVALLGSGQFSLPRNNRIVHRRLNHPWDTSEYCISILPTQRAPQSLRDSISALPAKVLLRIATSLWEKEDEPGRKPRNIFSMALVCKAWTHVLVVYFQKIGSPGTRIYHLGAVVKSLRYQPQMAEYMTTFHAVDTMAIDLCVEFISHCPFLCDLELPHLLYCQCRAMLSTRTNLKRLRVLSHRPIPNPDEVDTLPQLCDLARRWTKLETLHMPITESPQSTLSQMTGQINEPQLGTPLSPLYLQDLSLVGCQKPTLLAMDDLGHLMHSSSPLHTLQLTNIGGIPNKEMLNLLISFGETLKRLVILRCNFQMESQEEEHAIGAAMPHLRRVQFLEADFPTAGPAVIAKKPRCIDHVDGRCCRLKWAISGCKDDEGMIEEITQALQMTGWSNLYLYLEFTRAPAEGVITRLHRTAAQRKINFVLRSRIVANLGITS